MIIAIDGTSGSGKSTIAKKLAKELNFGFFSAGDLYRAITTKVLNLQINENDDEKLRDLINNTKIMYTFDGHSNNMVVDGINVTDKLHNEEVSATVSKIAQKPFVREFVRSLQKATAEYNENIVMEGRDIGSVIFPNADIKIFIDCSVEARAKRRFSDQIANGENINLEEVMANIKERDYLDTHREISPLVMCENAYLIDTTFNDIPHCLMLIYKEMLRRHIVDNEFFKKRGISTENL